jgi:hypothetical protein
LECWSNEKAEFDSPYSEIQYSNTPVLHFSITAWMIFCATRWSDL